MVTKLCTRNARGQVFRQVRGIDDVLHYDTTCLSVWHCKSPRGDENKYDIDEKCTGAYKAQVPSREKKVGTRKASVAKTRSVVTRAESKSLNSKTQSGAVKKIGRVGKKTVSSQKTSVSAKLKKTVGTTTKDKRKKHELAGAEYDAFVIKAAKHRQASPEELVTVDRRNTKPAVTEKQGDESTVSSVEIKERRQKVQRRRQIDPTTCERDYSQEEIEFMNALDEYKRNSGRMFPTCSEILEVFRGLGYAKLSHEESVEITVNPESHEVVITATEAGTSLQGYDVFDGEQYVSRVTL